MQYMIDNIQSGCVTILGLCLNRGLRTINTRWNVLDDYEPCSRCIQCQQYQKKADELKPKNVPLSSSRCVIYCLILIKLSRVQLGDYVLYHEFKN